MERSWWWKAVLYGIVTILAGLYLVPSLVPDDKRPAFLNKVFQKKIQLGLDLQGGLHLAYEVDLDKAIGGRVDRLANDIEERLRKEAPGGVTVSRQGRDGIVIDFKVPAEHAKLDNEFLKDYRNEFEAPSHDEAAGRVTLQLDPDYVSEVQDSALREAIERIRGRVDQYGVSEPTIIRKGTDIVVELPGLGQEQFDRIKNIIGRTAQLEFKIVDDESDYMRKVAARAAKDGPVTVQVDPWSEKNTGRQHETVYLQAPTRAALETFFAELPPELAIPQDRVIGYEEIATGDQPSAANAPRAWRTYLLKRRAGVTGDYLANAETSWDEMNRPVVAFQMNRQGAALMGRLTGENVGRKMAIVLDDRVTSAPVIESQISERGQITMGGMGDPFRIQEEVRDTVAVLRSGALPAPLRKSFETQVGPTMGKDAVDKARTSMLIGACAVVLFMLIYYRASGVIATLAMLLNMLFMIAILAAFEAALTLPGIAGLVLTVGMAVDANIIIYERIREELRLGKSPRTAVDTGFSRAFWTVFDGHVTTFVAGVVLYSYGSGPIRGFAVTLLIGIVTNLFTSVWMSRWMFDVMVGRRGAVPAKLSI